MGLQGKGQSIVSKPRPAFVFVCAVPVLDPPIKGIGGSPGKRTFLRVILRDRGIQSVAVERFPGMCADKPDNHLAETLQIQ